ncbi:hypothetical protein ACO2Q1_09120 [Brevundimonas sp. VNH65]|uniref:hypothetical protein n=1 Tax=Brevundimonas sp. VNH65 TaxID=3400917 RepID=UPI003C0F8080
MSLDFLTPRVERLSAAGAWTVEHAGGALGRFRSPVVLLARELTAFSRFPAAHLPRSRRRQAARLHARAAAPYAEAASLLTPSGPDIDVWWWDADRVSAQVQARFPGVRAALRPETLAQPAGDGWRIVALADGYEAQAWREGRLIASSWRRDRFDASAWNAFARAQRDMEDAPVAPPPPQRLPIDWDGPAFAFSTADVTREQVIGALGGGLALVAVAIALFLTGQGLRLKADAEEMEAETVEIAATTPGGATLADLEGDRRILAAYRQIEERTSPLSAAGAAIGVATLHDLSPIGLEATEEGLRLTLPYSALSSADLVIADLVESGYFHDVRPRTDAQSQTLAIEMKVREAAPPLGAAGG